MVRRALLGLLLLLLPACNETNTTASAPPSAMDLSDTQGRPTERKASFTLRVSADRLDAVARGHAAACRPPACEVTLLSVQLGDGRRPEGTFQARVRPDAFQAFTERLAADGRIVAARESSEDLTAPTLDAEARLGAQRALRERLAATLRDRNAMPLADLLTWEREQARVQGEIEAAESTLRQLATRAGTIAVGVGYQSARGGLLPEGAAPIEEALRDGLNLSIESFAEAIRFLLIALPWVPVLLIGWLIIGWLARRGRPKGAGPA